MERVIKDDIRAIVKKGSEQEMLNSDTDFLQ